MLSRSPRSSVRSSASPRSRATARSGPPGCSPASWPSTIASSTAHPPPDSSPPSPTHAPTQECCYERETSEHDYGDGPSPAAYSASNHVVARSDPGAPRLWRGGRAAWGGAPLEGNGSATTSLRRSLPAAGGDSVGRLG